MSDPAASPMLSKSRLGIPTKLASGFGSVIYGVKKNGFDYFLLTFSALVVGLDERLVGLAILIALIVAPHIIRPCRPWRIVR